LIDIPRCLTLAGNAEIKDEIRYLKDDCNRWKAFLQAYTDLLARGIQKNIRD
jgi:hypothetical protein